METFVATTFLILLNIILVLIIAGSIQGIINTQRDEKRKDEQARREKLEFEERMKDIRESGKHLR